MKTKLETIYPHRKPIHIELKEDDYIDVLEVTPEEFNKVYPGCGKRIGYHLYLNQDLKGIRLNFIRMSYEYVSVDLKNESGVEITTLPFLERLKEITAIYSKCRENKENEMKSLLEGNRGIEL